MRKAEPTKDGKKPTLETLRAWCNLEGDSTDNRALARASGICFILNNVSFAS